MAKTTTEINKKIPKKLNTSERDWDLLLVISLIISITSSSLGFGIFAFFLFGTLDQIYKRLEKILQELQKANEAAGINEKLQPSEDDGKS